MPTNRLRKSNKASLIHVEINFVGFKRQKAKVGHHGQSKLSCNHCTSYTFTYTSDMSVVLIIQVHTISAPHWSTLTERRIWNAPVLYLWKVQTFLHMRPSLFFFFNCRKVTLMPCLLPCNKMLKASPVKYRLCSRFRKIHSLPVHT